jgi:hypothetical protein
MAAMAAVSLGAMAGAGDVGVVKGPGCCASCGLVL